MQALNTNWKVRDSLIFEEPVEYKGGIASFEEMTVQTLKNLIALGYADPESTQNDSPTIAEFVKLMERHTDANSFLGAHGYVVSFERDDYRVSVEGVEGTVQHTEGLLDVLAICKSADEFEVESDFNVGFTVRAWWD